jgi:hypothetical protein
MAPSKESNMANTPDTVGLLRGIRDIDDPDILIRLHDAIRQQAAVLSTRQIRKFAIGDRVQFEHDRLGVMVGYVQKVNRKTVSVKTDHGTWRVGPAFLTPTGLIPRDTEG